MEPLSEDPGYTSLQIADIMTVSRVFATKYLQTLIRKEIHSQDWLRPQRLLEKQLNERKLNIEDKESVDIIVGAFVSRKGRDFAFVLIAFRSHLRYSRALCHAP